VAFALRYGGDAATATIWPLIVDGILTSGTVVLWMTRHSGKRRGRWAAWLTFGVGRAENVGALGGGEGEGRTPTDSELDRVFSTNNYGRGVLRRWRQEGRIPPTSNQAEGTDANLRRVMTYP
jgi:hypothetical protein